MSEQIINEKLDEINSITELEPGKPTIPVTVILQEAENLYNIAMMDKDALTQAGLDWTFVEDLPARLGALKVSQANWRAEYKSYQDCQVEWNNKAPLAFNLRDELLHHFFYALGEIPKEHSKVRRIAEGGSNADMIQDLIELSVLGMKHTGELEAIGFDISLLDEARARSFELGQLLAKVNGSMGEANPKRELRNKAYVHLKEAMDRIRRAGQYVFWRNEDKFKGYISDHLRKANKAKQDEAEIEDIQGELTK